MWQLNLTDFSLRKKDRLSKYYVRRKRPDGAVVLEEVLRETLKRGGVEHRLSGKLESRS